MRARTSWPEPRGSFVGRDRELALIKRVTRDSRAVTLVGAGGVGKTRLALELSRRGLKRGGFRFVGLQDVVDPDLVPEEVATALGLRLRGRGRALDLVADLANAERFVLVVDNCEQVGASCAAVLEELRARCPELHVLATSRTPLHFEGELAVPVDGLHESAAVRLFLDRAGTDHGGELVAELCARLDGVPLAVELAAHLTRLLSIQEILACLDGGLDLFTGNACAVPHRQRSLRSSFGWGYRLLSPPEQAVLRRLCLLPGGLPVSAAEEVCGWHPVPRAEVRALVRSLADQSLIRVACAPSRVRSLGPTRPYGAEEARRAGEEEETLCRAAAWLAGLAAPLHTAPAIRPVAQELLDAERDNLAHVVRALVGRPEHADTRVLLAAALARIWRTRDRVAEAAELVREVAAAHPGSVNLPVLLIERSRLDVAVGDAERAVEHAVAAVRAVSAQDRPALFVRAFKQLASVLGRRGTSEWVHKAIVLTGRSPAPELVLAQQDLAWFLLRTGDVAGARSVIDAALPVARGTRSADLGAVLCTAGAVALRRRELGLAVELFTEGVHAASADRVGLGYCLEGLALAASARGAHSRVVALIEAARTTWSAVGFWPAASWRRRSDAALASARQALPARDLQEARDTGATLTPEAALELFAG